MIMVGHNNQTGPASGHYRSPHLQYLDRPSAHSTPSPPQHYAQLPHPGQQPPPPPPPIARSTPTSYPSPASYPSPSMSAFQYPPQQPPPPPVSRGSPYSQPATINLPPIRLAPPNHQLQPPPPPPHEISSLPGSPLPPPTQPMYGGPPYYHPLPPPAVPHAQITSSPNHHPRYPLPSVSNPERIMSGGRHKKEIKRRTKTGCLTCRKRRIKCDEGHPTCKNCQKSKRDCLGYDPIFKSQPGPPAIQPAPSSGGQGSPGSYMPMSTMGPTYASALSTASSPASSCDTFDGYPPVDPALDATSHPQPPLMDPHGPYRHDLKRTLDRTSPFSSASDATRAPYTPVPRSSTPGGGISYSDSRNGNPAKRIKIDDLLSVGSGQPLSPPSSEQATVPTIINAPALNPIDGMKSIYQSLYAPALDHFLEVGWFQSKGADKMWGDHALAEVMGDLFERLKARGGSYLDEEDPTIQKSGWETDLLWAAVKMCYGTRIPVSDTRREDRRSEERAMAEGGDMEGAEALRRIAIVERILAGSSSEYAPPSPTTPAVNGEASNSSGHNRFWNLLEEISRFNGTGPDSEQKIRDLLMECDRCSRGYRNRAVLYHIAELRHLNVNSPEDQGRSKCIRDYLTGLANDRNLDNSSLERRIAGRALGLWDQPVPDTPFCMPAV